MLLPIVFTLALLSVLPTPSHAAVKQATPDSLVIQDSRVLHVTPAQAYAALVDVARWWNSEHTWSGSATNLSLKPEAGGCFCERWKDNSVQHMQVLWASKDHLLRLQGGLGPLQNMAVQGVMTFTLKPGDAGSTLQFEYRVNGTSGSGLDKLAAGVDGVLMQQLDRLQRYAETGNANSARP
ncbi:SRPBCC family protein [Rhodanobacter sp. C03]|uniref:SRPBCC family protein n=1 Tax=Rhodanobacter sp. C03 TaxID=1945858 RepID=UPI000987A453|nr:SRPBCC family protein [Rhodanobacter sp. C03]OOG53279.1 hypothetical protein B0E48_16480 [Rhodanobacter sp. C03]